MLFIQRLTLLFALLTLPSFPCWAGQQTSPGIDQVNQPQVKVYFDVNLGNAKKLETRLMLINTTYEEFVAQGSRPDVVIGFRGKASYFITKGTGYVEVQDRALKQKIHEWIHIFRSKGIQLEQCRIALKMTGIEADDLLPAVKVVANGYVSMIVYQNQGFSFVPMD